MQVRKQQLELDMEQRLVSNRKRSTSRLYIVTCLFNLYAEYIMSNAGLVELLTGINQMPGEISITSDMQMTSHYWQKWRGTKEPLDEGERGEWKSWLKTQHSKNKDHGIRSHHFIANRWGNNVNSDRLYSLGLQNHCRLWLQWWN